MAKTIFVPMAACFMAQATADANYGPHNCVSISRSPQGTCVFKTQCTGIDTSKFDFSFSCADSEGGFALHSFGLGGFDDMEEYDTEVKCASCGAPLPVVTAPARANLAVSAGVSMEPTKKEEFRVAKYGPEGNCISTYKSKSNTCILKTDCSENALDGMTMGFVCADAKGHMVRHDFGKDSFSHKEEFDTLIPCTQCLALDNFDSGKDTEEAVLKDELTVLKGDVNSLNTRVTKLEQSATKAEEKAGEKTEEKEEGEAEAIGGDANKALVHSGRQTKHRGHLRNLHKRKYHTAVVGKKAKRLQKEQKESRKHNREDDDDQDEDQDHFEDQDEDLEQNQDDEDQDEDEGKDEEEDEE